MTDPITLLAGLQGKTILIVEDEYILAEDLGLLVQRQGGRILGPCPDVDCALKLLRGRVQPDLALLDVNLRDEMVFPVADILMEREIPFVFVTGYDGSVLPPAYAHVPRLLKPLNLA